METLTAPRPARPPRLLYSLLEGRALLEMALLGPLLPVLPYASLDEAIRYINDRPRPLALYYFGGGAGRDRVLRETISGGVTVNNTLFHVAQEKLPFGGVGPSGMGEYHGIAGFRCFSKAKPIYQDGRLSGSLLMRPPYGRVFRTLMRLLYH